MSSRDPQTISKFKLAPIGVVMLGVRDRAVAFYRDMLGLTVKQEMPGFAFLDGGGVTLALSQPLARSAAQISAPPKEVRQYYGSSTLHPKP